MCPVRVNSLNCQKELPGADLLDGFILSQTLVLDRVLALLHDTKQHSLKYSSYVGPWIEFSLLLPFKTCYYKHL